MENTIIEKPKRGRKKKYTGDYTEEYKRNLRCPMCNNPTSGIEEYRNIRTGSLTKTCLKCRKRVYKSYKKIQKRPTQKETIEALYKIIDITDKEVITEKIKDKGEEAEPLLFFLKHRP